jgi:hypothetical protein
MWTLFIWAIIAHEVQANLVLKTVHARLLLEIMIYLQSLSEDVGLTHEIS